MTSTAQRLASLSGLSGGSAGAHLMAAGRGGPDAGTWLVSRSGLGVASAMAHLVAPGAMLEVDLSEIVCGGGGQAPLGPWPSRNFQKRKKRRRIEEKLLLLQITHYPYY